MEGIPRIETPPQEESIGRLREIFFDIEMKARLAGSGEILMQLDRIPGLLLGPMNRVSEGAEAMAVAVAHAALQNILSNLESSPPTTQRAS